MTEFRTSKTVKTARIAGLTFPDGQEVKYAEINGQAVFEGDIVLAPAQELAKAPMLPMGVVVSGLKHRWAKGIVPYQIHPDLPNKKRVTDAIAHWQQKTAFKFVERTGQNANQLPDYLSFEAQDGCWSYVGRQGGKQVVSLAAGCETGSAIHEIGHAIGLWHEQSREDRDNWVTINWENIEEDQEHNFEQHVTDGDDVGPYDYESIMHYPEWAFSKNDKPTIVPKQNRPIGQRKGLSQGDMQAVNALYLPLFGG